MLDNQIVPKITQNGNGKIPGLEQRIFTIAFIPTPSQSNIAKLWAAKLSEARQVLTEMSSACHRWQAIGEINPAELVDLMDKLDNHSLDTFIDELVSLAMVANCGADLCEVTK